MEFPWNRPLPPPPAPPPPPPDTDLRERVNALESRLAQMTADAGLLRVEWAEVLDKISHWASRQSGRDGKKAKENLDRLAQDDPGAANAGREGTGVHPFTKADLRRLAAQRRQPNGA